MWSLVQHRQLGRQVEREWLDRKGKHVNNKDESADIELCLAHSPSPTEPITEKPGSNSNLPGHTSLAGNVSPATSDNEKHDHGQILVDIEGDADTIDPRNWALSSRCKNIAILSLLIFVQGWAGAADSQANTSISTAFGVSKTAENLSQAMYLFGIGSGSLFVGPISETFGRNPVYLVSSFCYLLSVLGTALTPTFGGQVVCRYLVGLFASATLAINGASVGDQFRPVKRAFVFPVIAWANVAGKDMPKSSPMFAFEIDMLIWVVAPMMAPIAGGWIVSAASLGWRWCEWVTLIISAGAFLVALVFLPETYLPVLLDWKAKHLRDVSGSQRYVSKHAETASLLARLREVLPMPVTFFRTEPVIAVLGGYLILLYILLFTFLSGFDYIFKETYQLSTGLTGSCFASIAAGSTAFTLGAPWLYSWARRKTHSVSGAPVPPEFRLCCDFNSAAVTCFSFLARLDELSYDLTVVRSLFLLCVRDCSDSYVCKHLRIHYRQLWRTRGRGTG